MEHGAGPFQAIEQSGLSLTIRDAVLIYPVANVLHVLAVLVFFAAVAAMDLRILGWIGASDSVEIVVRRFRRIAIGALVVLVVTGAILFVPEAGALARNPSFQMKAGLVLIGLINVVVMEIALRRDAASDLARASALASLLIWLAVAACGRFVAYV